MEKRSPVILRDALSGNWLHFQNPHQIITTNNLDEVLPGLEQIESLVNERGWYAAGFVSYEAAPAYDSALTVSPAGDFPLLWFGLYDEPRRTASLPAKDGDYQLRGWTPSVSRTDYDDAIAQVKNHIARGETYQVNYSFRLRSPFRGSPWSLFVDMVEAQSAGPTQTGYSTYLETERHVICSASPELFFRLDGDAITCRPMKGTLKRGRTLAEDLAQVEIGRASCRERVYVQV
jgi:para-aminobenzoate synthetase/4-amino-4-deoxychorismate lyase